jgi:ribosome recycling factor
MIKDAEKEKQVSEDERKKGEKSIQDLTDRYIAHIEEIAKSKDKEIMEL